MQSYIFALTILSSRQIDASASHEARLDVVPSGVWPVVASLGTPVLEIFLAIETYIHKEYVLKQKKSFTNFPLQVLNIILA